MEFYTNDINLNNINKNKIFKITKCAETILDVWLSEGTEDIEEGTEGVITYRKAAEGIYGDIERPITAEDGNTVESITFSLYTEIFRFIHKRNYKLIRLWNYVPLILKDLNQSSPDIEIYRCFNSGRYKAFRKYYGEDLQTWIIPAASAVGSINDNLKIEFFASSTESLFFENKVQTPAYQYSVKYGKLPPVFSRGAIYSFRDETLLISSGTASVLKEESVYAGDIYHQIHQSMDNLRFLGSNSNLKGYGIQYEFGLKDLVLLRVYYKYAKDKGLIESEIEKMITPGCKLAFVHTDICRKDLDVEIEGIFRKKGL